MVGESRLVKAEWHRVYAWVGHAWHVNGPEYPWVCIGVVLGAKGEVQFV